MKRTAIIFLLISLLVNIKIYCQNIEPYQNKPITIDTAKTINTIKSKEIETHRSKQIDPYTSKQIEPYHSKEITPYKAKEIEVYKAKTIEPIKQRELKQQEIKPAIQNPSINTPADNQQTQNRNTSTRQKETTGQVTIEGLFGRWHTKVPGAVWQTPSGLDGYNNLHVSAGAQAGDLVIRKDGTYSWNSYGGKKGKWIKGDSEYPLVLIDNVEKKRW